MQGKRRYSSTAVGFPQAPMQKHINQLLTKKTGQSGKQTEYIKNFQQVIQR